MSTGDRSVTLGDGSATRSVTTQMTQDQQVTSAVTDVTDAPGKSVTRARTHAHAEVTENSVTTCHPSPIAPSGIDSDAKRYATCAYDDPAKPVYTPADEFLEFKRSVRFAAIDVMILTFGARRHAEWLSEIGICPPDVARLIRNDLAYITSVLDRACQPAAKPTPTATPSPDVGPRLPRPARAEAAPTSLWDATGGDVGETGEGARVAEKNGS